MIAVNCLGKSNVELNQLLEYTVLNKASDLHLSAGEAPIVRIDGDLQRTSFPILENNALAKMIKSSMKDSQSELFKKQLELDYCYEGYKKKRFRINVFTTQNGIAAAFRPIPLEIPTLEALGLPNIMRELCQHQNGLIIIGGPTGSGKSTSLAAMMDYINKHYKRHIVTIEDPVEYTYKNKLSLFNQREVGRDTLSFNAALRSVLREDPDNILLGELRDLETIQLALTAAETGHLVFTTLHTNSAAKAIDRIIDVFPADSKLLIRSMLSESLRAIVSQTLLKKTNGGRIAALEILIATPAIRNLIRENKIAQIFSAIQTGREHGMFSRDQHIKELLESGQISA